MYQHFFNNYRMPSQPIQRRSFKQTVVTQECIEGNDDETSSWLEPNTIVTEVRTSSVTFPPNCCLSAYEEFLNNAKPPPPKPVSQFLNKTSTFILDIGLFICCLFILVIENSNFSDLCSRLMYKRTSARKNTREIFFVANPLKLIGK